MSASTNNTTANKQNEQSLKVAELSNREYIHPPTNILKQFINDNTNWKWNLLTTHLSKDFNLLSFVLQAKKENTFEDQIWLRFVHTPLLNCRRNELLAVCNECQYISLLLSHLNKLGRNLMGRWALGTRSIKSKIAALQEIMEEHKLNTEHVSWKHILKDIILIGFVFLSLFLFVFLNKSPLAKSKQNIINLLKDFFS
jgi:hypothetical protein